MRRSNRPWVRRNPASRTGPNPPREPPARSPICSRSPLRDVLPLAPGRSAIFRVAEPGAEAAAGAPVRTLRRGGRFGRGRRSGGAGRDEAEPESPCPLGRCTLGSALYAARRDPLGRERLV